ncbi:MAG: hypothetical protein LBG19_08090 [Prevotellaceae bacterium]|jgi:chromosomal replication initiation ATPase DnaA|nr:hypothetical protein [Prevotellaceae bacterium]
MQPIQCKDNEDNELEVAITEVLHWCKPYTFLADNTTEEESEQEEPIRTDPLTITWTLDSLLTYCCNKTGITPEELCSRTKSRTVTAARGIYCYLASGLTSSSLNNIGKKIGIAHNMAMYYRNTVKGYVECGDKRTIATLALLNININFLLSMRKKS